MNADSRSARRLCPVNGREYRQVSRKVVLHQLSSPSLEPLAARRYYDCSDPDCRVTYFRDDDVVLEVRSLRAQSKNTIREWKQLACHCFGISRREALSDARALLQAIS